MIPYHDENATERTAFVTLSDGSWLSLPEVCPIRRPGVLDHQYGWLALASSQFYSGAIAWRSGPRSTASSP